MTNVVGQDYQHTILHTAKEIELLKEQIACLEQARKNERGIPRTLFICCVIYSVALLFAFLTHGYTSVFISASFPVIGYLTSSIVLFTFRIVRTRKIAKQHDGTEQNDAAEQNIHEVA